MIPTRDVERAACRQQRRELVRRARNRVLAADRHQHWSVNRRDLIARQGLTRTTNARRERLQVGFGLLGESTKRASTES